jgi:hypothetical protein
MLAPLVGKFCASCRDSCRGGTVPRVGGSIRATWEGAEAPVKDRQDGEPVRLVRMTALSLAETASPVSRHAAAAARQA